MLDLICNFLIFVSHLLTLMLLKMKLLLCIPSKTKDYFLVSGVTDVLKNLINNDLCDVLPQTFKLFQLIATIPATTASVERSFSSLKRIKSAFRSTMCQERLTNLA